MKNKKILLKILIIALIITVVPTYSFATTGKSTVAKYSSLFTKKWYTPLKKEYGKICNDYVQYPNENERQCRWIYDALCDEYREVIENTPQRTTEYILKGEIFVGYHFNYSSDGSYSFTKKDNSKYTVNDIKKFIIDNNDEFYSFATFYDKCMNEYTDWGWQYKWLVKCSDYMRKYSAISFFPELSSQMKIISNSSFNKLSKAMKIYAIDRSQYFDCRYSRKGKYGMIYNTNASGCTSKMSNATRMKNLYHNKAQGVCMDYANYEKTYFQSLGIKTWYRRSSKISHAWTVVKVKNSKGKILWIPFDYGIGPAEHLRVNNNQMKYIDTEKKRFNLYLKGIAGSPNYKNYSIVDFN